MQQVQTIRPPLKTAHRPPRVMVYCHDGVGIGHLRRSLAICEHLARRIPASSFLLATGTPYVPLFELSPGIDYLKLPALIKRNDGAYHSKYLSIHMRQLWRCRQALLLTGAQYFEPDVLLVDKTPVGARRELVPTLRWLQRNRPRTRLIFGMRDIEDEPAATLRQWLANGALAALGEFYDQVWVYGMEAVFDVAREYRLPPAVRGKLRYVGYIGRPGCPHPPPERNGEPYVLVTVGGGSDGQRCLSSYLSAAAARVAEAGGRSVIIGGPDLPPAAAAELRARAAQTPRTTWFDATRCMACHMRCADLVVCMGGYNTLCEVVSLQKPALVVPRVKPRLEQAIRAARWERLGLVRSMGPTFTPQELADRVLAILSRPVGPPANPLDMGALDRIGRQFDGWFRPDGECES